MRLWAKGIADAEVASEARKKADQLLMIEPDLSVLRSDRRWLQLAYEFETSHEGAIIVNPRNRFAKSLAEFDTDWLHDMNLVYQAVQYWKDFHKRPAGMK